MTNPQISILMPAYNAGKYLHEAIDSMLNQTFHDFELLLLDDCSTDNTEEIVAGYADKRIRYIRQKKNIGLANNLNEGLKLARGKYIARMDGDDISLPKRLQTQIDFLEAHPDIDLCSCGLQMFGRENTVWIRESDPEDVKITMLFYSPVLHATSMWRRESFEKHNLQYNQDMFPAEDYDLWSRAVFYCKLVNIPKVLYKYRIHGIQVTKINDRAGEKVRQIQLKFLKNALPSLDDEKCMDFVDNFVLNKDIGIKTIRTLKTVYKSVLVSNEKDAFFDSLVLRTRLKRYYQNLVAEQIAKEAFSPISISLLLDLRIRQIVKLMLIKR